jgi:hypothetical protein
LRKRYYIIFVARQEDGELRKIPIPLHYAYIFVAAAVIGLFTITGMAGSYSRMLLKTARFNQIRTERETIRHDYLFRPLLWVRSPAKSVLFTGCGKAG